MTNKTKWQDISDVLTPEGIERIKVGQVLTFKNEDTETNLKIRRKSKGKVWAEQVYLYKEDEVEVTDKEQQ